jgi:hypothetical protein
VDDHLASLRDDARQNLIDEEVLQDFVAQTSDPVNPDAPA